jgi:hypothetical protein
LQVVLSDGHSYERRHIERWLTCKKTSPVTGAPLDNSVMFPNHSLRNSIEEYFKSIMDVQKKAIHNAAKDTQFKNNFNSNIDLQRTIDSLMETSVLVNADMSSEVVLRRIIDEAKQLIGAEVASVFLVDNENDQLYSTINSTDGEIRIPKSAGIAGHVATSGEAVIIHDAYTDARFNQSVDKSTGFKTRNILCVPIKTKKGNVIGVAQLINKQAGGALQIHSSAAEEQFASNDQRFLEVFASQAASAIASSGGSFEPEKALHSAGSVRDMEHSDKNASKPLLFTSFPSEPMVQEEDLKSNSSKGSNSGNDAASTGSLTPVEPPSPAVEPSSSTNAALTSTSSILSNKQEVEKLLAYALEGFDTDVLKLEELTLGKPLSTLAEHLFSSNNLFKKFNIDIDKFRNFVLEIEKGYGASNAYHNKAHAASVLHMCHALMKHGNVAKIVGEGQWFKRIKVDTNNADGDENKEQVGDFEFFACLFAAIIHDYEHPGVNNQFLVRSLSTRSLLFNNAHVNEQHHVSAAYQVMLKPDCNFMENSFSNNNEFVEFRQLVIDLVIGTDMEDNKKINTQLQDALKAAREAFNAKSSSSSSSADTTTTSESAAAAALTSSSATVEEPVEPAFDAPFEFKPSTKEEATVSLQMALKAADLGHLALPWNMHFTWVSNLQNEFFVQGDKERELGFESISFLMDRNKPGVMQSQVGFFNFIVMPLFTNLHDAFPEALPMKKVVDDNFEKWKLLDAQEKELSLISSN